MAAQQICLKWNSFQANILTSFESLWEEEGLVDVTLASDGECIRAHKVILSACSPFFKRLFQANPCQHPVIILQDVHFSELESLLNFVYKGEVNIDQDNLPALLRAAETLQIRGLSGASEQLKEKMGLPKTSSSVPTHQTARDGSPPYKRRRSVQPPRSPALPTTPVASVPTSHPDYSKHPSSSSTDTNQQTPDPDEPMMMMMHKIEARSSESGSPEPPSLSVEDGFDESVDETLDLKASQVSETEQLKVLKNFPYPPFPCPFCDRAYTSWGFRRRHIKGVHTYSPRLSCKWCLEVLPSHSEWESHVILEHHLSQSDAHNGLLILEEAHMVLQIPNPTRLDAFVNMIQQSGEAGASGGPGCDRGSGT